MAIRNIREIGEEVLGKKCRMVTEMTPRIRELIEDMLDTMYEANGVGLAAPQVGVLKRIVVIDTTGEDPHILINPRIVESSGEQTGQEACLSVPGKTGQVTRPNYVKAVALDVNMKEFELEGTELLAGPSAMNWTIWRDSSMWKRQRDRCRMPSLRKKRNKTEVFG